MLLQPFDVLLKWVETVNNEYKNSHVQFSLNQLKDKENAILPVENYLTGNNIRLKFDYKPKEGETIPLYIYSDYISLKVTIKFNKGKPEIKDISVI